jgi:hypothetical protein
MEVLEESEGNDCEKDMVETTFSMPDLWAF